MLLNWVREFEKWTPSINVIMYDGAPEERKQMRADIMKGSFNVLVTHYDMVIRDKNVFKKVGPCCVFHECVFLLFCV